MAEGVTLGSAASPGHGGFSMPAEWEPHDATWLCWPHRDDDWPGKLDCVRWVYVEMIRWLAAQEKVHLIVQSENHGAQVRESLARTGIGAEAVSFLECPMDRSWIRDNGPIFIRRTSPQTEIAIARFRFNGWAMYPEWSRDDQIPGHAAQFLACPTFPCERNGQPVVLEGGAIDVNGSGSLLATEQCLLSATQARNPHLDKPEVESVFADYLGVKNVMWLAGGIEGDETHGHIDDVCRFVNARCVVACREANANDANYRPLEENWERLQGMRLEGGDKLESVALPMPDPVYYDGYRLPASYANFYVANDLVLVPTYNDPNDYRAIGVINELFPSRRVIGIHSIDLLAGGGAIHCSTQQQPSSNVPSA